MVDLLDVLFRLYSPLSWILCSSYYIPITVYHLLVNRQFSTLFSPSKFKEIWFATMWETYGPRVKAFVQPVVTPLISLAYGIVLDVGPGSGEWLDLFDKSKVTKIYGVEPNRDHHALLRQRIIKAGLSDVYHIVPVGIEDLDGKGLYGGEEKEGGWIQKQEVDCIVTLQCLCSVPHPKELIKGLYLYLKEGGIWIVFEHVVTKQGGLVKLYQSLIDLIFPHFMGGCSITRDTETWLKEAGYWQKVELTELAGTPTYQIIPFILGVLTK